MLTTFSVLCLIAFRNSEVRGSQLPSASLGLGEACWSLHLPSGVFDPKAPGLSPLVGIPTNRA